MAEALFSQLDVDGSSWSTTTSARAAFEPLRFVPKGKMVVLGLVTTKRPELESRMRLKRRVDDGGQVRARCSVCLSGSAASSSTWRATR